MKEEIETLKLKIELKKLEVELEKVKHEEYWKPIIEIKLKDKEE